MFRLCIKLSITRTVLALSPYDEIHVFVDVPYEKSALNGHLLLVPLLDAI